MKELSQNKELQEILGSNGLNEINGKYKKNYVIKKYISLIESLIKF